MANSAVRFPAHESGPAPSTISVTSRSGRVEVNASARADIEVAGAGRAELRRDAGAQQVEVSGTHEHMVVSCPVGTDVIIGTLSGRVELSGRFGAVRVTTSSGRVAVAEAASVDARTRSGTIRVGRCDGVVRVRSTSARVDVEAAAQLDAETASGAITAGAIDDATVRSTCGRVALGLNGSGSVAARTVSGRVEISVPTGACPDMTLRTVSGRIDASIESGDDGVVGVETVSGRIRVRTR